MPRLSRKDLESISERIYTAYRKLPELSGKKIYYIDPKLMLKLLRLKLDHCRLSQDGTILGLTSFSEVCVEVWDDNREELFYCLDGKTVLVDDRLREDVSQKGRYNFTIMHEAGHQILGMLFPGEYKQRAARIHYCKESGCKYPVEDWNEWQANTLAAYLLMPKDLVEQGMFLFGLGDKISILNKKYRSKSYNRFADLTHLLGVSKKALSIRMMHLGLLQEDQLQDPDIMLEVVKDSGVV